MNDTTKNITDDNKAKKMEIIKILRKETGISLMLCSESATESNYDLNIARHILREKCIQLGEKFYKNPEKPILYYGINYEQSANKIQGIKVGCQSDFLISSGSSFFALSEFVFKMQNLEELNKEELDLIETECKYHSGLTKENFLLLSVFSMKINKDEKVFVLKNTTESNPLLFSSITFIKYTSQDNINQILEENPELLTQLSINLHSNLKKTIVNIPSEKKSVNYITYLKTKDDILSFTQNRSFTNKDKTVGDIVSDISKTMTILEILAV